MKDKDGKVIFPPGTNEYAGQPPAERTYPEVEGWRRLDATDRIMFIRWITDLSSHRQMVGREQYGDTFQGDPLIHLAEELVDGLFYCFEAWRERSALKEKINGQPTGTDYPTV